MRASDPLGDRELDWADDEPALGSPNRRGYGDESQERSAVAGRDVRDLDPAESGIGDGDGLLEQIVERGWMARYVL